MAHRGGHRSSYGLRQPQQVALAVAEPGATFPGALARVVALDPRYPVLDFEAGQIDLLERDPAAPQFRDRRTYVLDLEPDLGELSGGRPRREEQVELPAPRTGSGGRPRAPPQALARACPCRKPSRVPGPRQAVS